MSELEGWQQRVAALWERFDDVPRANLQAPDPPDGLRMQKSL